MCRNDKRFSGVYVVQGTKLRPLEGNVEKTVVCLDNLHFAKSIF